MSMYMGADTPVLTIERYHNGADPRTPHYSIEVSSKNGGWPMARRMVLSATETAKALREFADRIDPEVDST